MLRATATMPLTFFGITLLVCLISWFKDIDKTNLNSTLFKHQDMTMNCINEVCIYRSSAISILRITTTRLPALARLVGLHLIHWSLSHLQTHAF